MGTAGVSLLAITALNLVTPWLVRGLVSALTEGVGIYFHLYAAAIILVALCFQGGIHLPYRYLSHVAAWNLVSDMRVKVYEHLQKLSEVLPRQADRTADVRTINDKHPLRHSPCHTRPADE